MSYTLGILDQSPILGDQTPESALADTIELAQLAESLGYQRFWVSEHHNNPALAGSSPEVLVSYLLAKTNTIRIGSGGVMLQHYSPYKVAENFNLLASLAPDRVDLGVGKAPGGLPYATKALQFGRPTSGIDFYEQAALTKQFLHDELPKNHEFASVKATPKPATAPQMFMLGTSVESAREAAKLEIGFVFAGFINQDQEALAQAATAYRSQFPGGHFAVAVSVIAAPTAREAEALAATKTIAKIYLESGKSYSFSSLAAAKQFGLEAGEPFTVAEQDAGILHGTPEALHAVFETMSERFQINEFILHTPVENAEKRRRSWELLSPGRRG